MGDLFDAIARGDQAEVERLIQEGALEAMSLGAEGSKARLEAIDLSLGASGLPRRMKELAADRIARDSCDEELGRILEAASSENRPILEAFFATSIADEAAEELARSSDAGKAEARLGDVIGRYARGASSLGEEAFAMSLRRLKESLPRRIAEWAEEGSGELRSGVKSSIARILAESCDLGEAKAPLIFDALAARGKEVSPSFPSGGPGAKVMSLRDWRASGSGSKLRAGK